jgi:O-antigen/teichoic acid export membrane protein
MGVPILNILSGFIIGWFAVLRAEGLYDNMRQRMSRILTYSFVCSAITMGVMLAIWTWTIPLAFGPVAELENFGHPMILFEPRLSFIGWLVLMILISPFLQLLTSVFSAFLAMRPAKPRS